MDNYIYQKLNYPTLFKKKNNFLSVLSGKLSSRSIIFLWIIFQFFVGLILCMDSLNHIQGRVHPDEKYHLKIIEETLSDASLAMPVHNGEPWYTKPPLLLWLGFGISKLTGLSYWGGIRIVSILSWILCSLLIFIFVKKSLTSFSTSEAEAQAAKTTILSTSCLSVLTFSHFGMMDIPLLASLLSVPLLTLCWWKSGQKTPQTIALSLGLALGGWWKGPVFYFLIFLPVISILPLQYGQTLRLFFRYAHWIILSLIIGNGWILWNLYLYKGWYLQKFILGENLTRLNGLNISSLIKFLILGSFPFWREVWGQSLNNYNIKIEYAHARAGLMLAVSTILVFGFCTKPHFHWFIVVPVGLLLWNAIPYEEVFHINWWVNILNYSIFLLIPCITIIFFAFALYAGITVSLFSQISMILISFLVSIVGYQSISLSQRVALGVTFTLFWGTLIWIITPSMFYKKTDSVITEKAIYKSNISIRKFNQNNSKEINAALISLLKTPTKNSFDKLIQTSVISIEPQKVKAAY